MNASRRRLLRLAAAVSAAALGLTLSAPAQAGTAQAGYCHLGWGKLERAKGHVVLNLRCTPHDPRDRLYGINLWADDLVTDDLIEAYRLTPCVPPKEIRWPRTT